MQDINYNELFNSPKLVKLISATLRCWSCGDEKNEIYLNLFAQYNDGKQFRNIFGHGSHCPTCKNLVILDGDNMPMLSANYDSDIYFEGSDFIGKARYLHNLHTNRKNYQSKKGRNKNKKQKIKKQYKYTCAAPKVKKVIYV